MLPQAVAQQVVRQLEPDLERAQRRLRDEPLALVDRAGASRRSARRGSPARVLAVADHRLAVGPGPAASTARAARRRSARPRSGSPAGSPATLDDRNASSAAARSARGRAAPSTGRSPTRAAPGEQPRARRPGQDRAVERRRRELERPRRRRGRTRKMLADVPSDRWSSMVRNRASSAPARRASSRA